MVNPSPPFHNNRKAGHEGKAGSGEEGRKKRTQQGNTMVFGVTCVLAELRAHYPEHQRQEEEEKEEDERRDHTPHTHRHSTTHNTMRQDKTCTVITRCHHNTHTTEMRTTTRMVLGNTMKGPRGNASRGQHNDTPLPPFNKTTMRTRRGTPMTDGRVSAIAPAPPSIRRPSSQHAPPSTTAPPTTTARRGRRGCPTPRTAQTRAHHPHTTHPARNSARHDSSTRQHCNGMSKARAAPLHRAGQQQHTPPPFHTPRKVNTIHSSTHLLLLIRVHTTNEQQ